ncbi:MAG: family 20 glycosylhydrolase, partial [bacterium]|nr:family 20 glycosylhydrolase [bacterium]
MIKKTMLLFLILLLALNCFGKKGNTMIKKLNLMPMPKKALFFADTFRVDQSFSAAVESVSKAPTHRVLNALRRTLNRLAGRTGFFFTEDQIKPHTENTSFRVTFQRFGKLKLYEDETYKLLIKSDGIHLNAVTDIGILRGLETLLQLLGADKDGYFFPAVTITDEPRFAWRGLLIDSCRHFMPVDVIKRNLDGMAAVKMNVLHWHLTEDQGFRVECKTFPKLHQMGSDGLYYTHEQIRDVITYAAGLGIRVMPEFDIPGHSTSWLVGYPQYGSAPGPYTIERGYGIKDPAFNPSLKATYKFFDKFFKEMA